jgi:hypothetical protein
LFTKAFAYIQSTWLVVQSIARVFQGLPITQLELATIAFVVCALIIYILWWDKPFGVDRHTVLTAITYEWEKGKEFESLSPIYSSTRIPDLDNDTFLDICIGGLDFHDTQKLKEILRRLIGRIFGRPGLIRPSQDAIRSLAFYTGGTIFSAFHIGAWNWEFPSPVVRTLWRTFALTSTCTGPATIVLVFFAVVIDNHNANNDFPETVLLLTWFFLLLIYIICRLALIVLIFYCFSSMPAGVYETVSWTKFLPHFS